MLAIMLEISASMTQLNTREYAILETHSMKETGADIRRQRFHSVYGRPHEDAQTAFSNLSTLENVFEFMRLR